MHKKSIQRPLAPQKAAQLIPRHRFRIKHYSELQDLTREIENLILVGTAPSVGDICLDASLCLEKEYFIFAVNMSILAFRNADFLFWSDIGVHRLIWRLIENEHIFPRHTICPANLIVGHRSTHYYRRDDFPGLIDSGTNAIRIINQCFSIENLYLVGYDYYIKEQQHFYKEGSYKEVRAMKTEAFRKRLEDMRVAAKAELDQGSYNVWQTNPESRLTYPLKSIDDLVANS